MKNELSTALPVSTCGWLFKPLLITGHERFAFCVDAGREFLESFIQSLAVRCKGEEIGGRLPIRRFADEVMFAAHMERTTRVQRQVAAQTDPGGGVRRIMRLISDLHEEILRQGVVAAIGVRVLVPVRCDQRVALFLEGEITPHAMTDLHRRGCLVVHHLDLHRQLLRVLDDRNPLHQRVGQQGQLVSELHAFDSAAAAVAERKEFRVVEG